MCKKNECCGGEVLSGDFLALIIVLAIVVVFLTGLGGEEKKC